MLGYSPINKRQHPDMAIVDDWGVKLKIKENIYSGATTIYTIYWTQRIQFKFVSFQEAYCLIIADLYYRISLLSMIGYRPNGSTIYVGFVQFLIKASSFCSIRWNLALI